MNISIIGTGYVGLVAACCFAHSGHKVIAIEKNLDKLRKLERGELPIYEEGLAEIFTEVNSQKKIVFSNDLNEAVEHSSYIFIAVGTPSLPDGRVDFSQVYEVITSIVELAEKPITIIMKSTVPPGTGKAIAKRYFGKAKTSIKYVSNPEFLREGKAVWDWYHPDRIVLGVDEDEVTGEISDLYKDIEAPKVCMDVTSAEMVKYAANAFLATKISFINEIANLCELVGADIDHVAPTVGMDKRIGPYFLNAGIGYGGSCFPKDTKGLNYISTYSGYNFNLLKAVIEVNSNQYIYVIRKMIKGLGDLFGKKITVLGLAFKPGTDDIREAPAIEIIDQLLNEGAQIAVSDPMAIENARNKFNTKMVEFYTNPYQACIGSSAILLATEWPEYTDLDWRNIKKQMQPPFLIIDGRNILDQKKLKENGFLYMGVGRV